MSFLLHSPTLDDLQRLTTSITANSAGVTVVGTVPYFDLGEPPPAFNVDTSSMKAFGAFRVVCDWSTLDVGSANESYLVELQGSNTTNFSSTYRLGSMLLGHSSVTGNAVSTPPNGRRSFLCDNIIMPSATSAAAYATARYVRLAVTPSAGSTTPNIVVTGAWLLPA